MTLPEPFKIALKRLKLARRAAMKHLIDRYDQLGTESWVPMTGRQMAEHIGCSRQTADRSLADLVAMRFTDGEVASFADRKKNPSRYKLNMLPFNGAKPKHEYMLGHEWAALRQRSWRPVEPRFKVTIEGVPGSDIETILKDHSERPASVQPAF
jgi:hypothetical protein